MPSEVRFAEVKRLLGQAGYVLVRISGSHHIFEKENAQHIVIPVHKGKVKPFYVREIKKVINED
jgi:predicted RNA binding protein YcfA (HicA-like mRNA interferase family)